ncbi:hypothetical protein Pelo_9455 [Pelomyxa schiedti]|nr:hypothetical protein Pelo_9455 [Pelomyxa schiedti]
MLEGHSAEEVLSTDEWPDTVRGLIRVLLVCSDESSSVGDREKVKWFMSSLKHLSRLEKCGGSVCGETVVLGICEIFSSMLDKLVLPSTNSPSVPNHHLITLVELFEKRTTIKSVHMRAICRMLAGVFANMPSWWQKLSPESLENVLHRIGTLCTKCMDAKGSPMSAAIVSLSLTTATSPHWLLKWMKGPHAHKVFEVLDTVGFVNYLEQSLVHSESEIRSIFKTCLAASGNILNNNELAHYAVLCHAAHATSMAGVLLSTSYWKSGIGAKTCLTKIVEMLEIIAMNPPSTKKIEHGIQTLCEVLCVVLTNLSSCAWLEPIIQAPFMMEKFLNLLRMPVQTGVPFYAGVIGAICLTLSSFCPHSAICSIQESVLQCVVDRLTQCDLQGLYIIVQLLQLYSSLKAYNVNPTPTGTSTVIFPIMQLALTSGSEELISAVTQPMAVLLMLHPCEIAISLRHTTPFSLSQIALLVSQQSDYGILAKFGTLVSSLCVSTLESIGSTFSSVVSDLFPFISEMVSPSNQQPPSVFYVALREVSFDNQPIDDQFYHPPQSNSTAHYSLSLARVLACNPHLPSLLLQPDNWLHGPGSILQIIDNLVVFYDFETTGSSDPYCAALVVVNDMAWNLDCLIFIQERINLAHTLLEQHTSIDESPATKLRNDILWRCCAPLGPTEMPASPSIISEFPPTLSSSKSFESVMNNESVVAIIHKLHDSILPLAFSPAGWDIIPPLLSQPMCSQFFSMILSQWLCGKQISQAIKSTNTGSQQKTSSTLELFLHRYATFLRLPIPPSCEQFAAELSCTVSGSEQPRPAIDWFAANLYLMTCNVKLTQDLLSWCSINRKTEISFIWRRLRPVVPDEIDPWIACITQVLWLIIRTESQLLFNAFLDSRLPLYHVVYRWTNQCFLTYLDWTDITHFFLLSFLTGPDFCVYLCAAMLMHMQTALLDCCSRGGSLLHMLLTRGCPGFHIKESLETLQVLSSKYHNHFLSLYNSGLFGP